MNTGAPAFRVLLHMRIHAGLEPEFERAWREVGRAVAAHPACLGQWLSRSNTDASMYYVVSDWADEAQFREFETSPAHRRQLETLRPYRSGGSMTTMHTVCSVPPARAEP